MKEESRIKPRKLDFEAISISVSPFKEKCRPITLDSGAIYEGEWIGSVREGYGKCLWPDGSTYEGQWKADRANGEGTMKYTDGEKYEGDFQND